MLFQQAIGHYQSGQADSARKICQSLCQGGSASAQAWCLLSVINSDLGDYEAALESASESARLQPGYEDAWLNIGASLINLEQLEAAIKPLKKLLQINPQHVQGRAILGDAYLYSSRFDDAIECYLQALQQQAENIDLICHLSDAYEHSHRLQLARELIQRVLARSPGHTEANIIAARIDRREKRYHEACQRLVKIDRSKLASKHIEAICYETGLVCDRLQQYEEAFSAFRECMQITASRYAGKFNYKTFVGRIHRYKQAFNKTDISAWENYKPQRNEPQAPVFLVGFPRSGTTLTEQILSAHSSVYTSNESPIINSLATDLSTLSAGQVKDFPYGLGQLSEEAIYTLRHEYWRRVAINSLNDKQASRYLDKLPLNLVETGFIKRIFPDATLIFACRDPRDVCLSCFFQRFRSNNAMSAFEDIETTADLYKETLDLWFHYQCVFDLEFYTSRYEDLASCFEQNVRQLIEYLGLDWEDSVLDYNSPDKHRDILTPSYQDISQPVYTRSIGRWKNYERELQPILGTLKPYVERLGYSD